jgi:hypothetical protein
MPPGETRDVMAATSVVAASTRSIAPAPATRSRRAIRMLTIPLPDSSLAERRYRGSTLPGGSAARSGGAARARHELLWVRLLERDRRSDGGGEGRPPGPPRWRQRLPRPCGGPRSKDDPRAALCDGRPEAARTAASGRSSGAGLSHRQTAPRFPGSGSRTASRLRGPVGPAGGHLVCPPTGEVGPNGPARRSRAAESPRWWRAASPCGSDRV